METRLEQIARDFLGFKSLETKNNDDADFRNVAVWQIKAALIEAFMAGQKSMDE